MHFLNKNCEFCLRFHISLKLVPNIPFDNITALVQIMAWGLNGSMPLSQPMTVSLLTHICVTRFQWVSCLIPEKNGRQYNSWCIKHQPCSSLRCCSLHDDVIKWNPFRITGPLCGDQWPVTPPPPPPHTTTTTTTHTHTHTLKGQWRGALNFSLICAWINGWANNHEAGDLRRHRAHNDVTLMVGAFIITTFQNTSIN